MTRQLNIIRFSSEEIRERLGLPSGVNVIDVRIDFLTQALEVVVEGAACEPVPEGRRIAVATVEELNERSLRNELHLARRKV